MKKALIIENGLVTQVEDHPFDIAPPYFWVDCSDDIVPHQYTYQNGQFIKIAIPDTPVSPDDNKLKAMQILNNTNIYTFSEYTQPDKQDWINYRTQIMAIWVNPPEGNVNWPIPPQ
jgi:hypothetical protein